MADHATAAADPNGETTPEGAGDEVVRQARLPRWTRQEILVLIQGKRVAETRSRRGRAVMAAEGPGIGSVQLEPKWASVSSYCRRHGVNRGPVQCRKRWSNLAGDYKKIKEWEGIAGREGKESFWAMRNDFRRERKLPGFFDRAVYDILDRGVGERTAMEVEGEDVLAREEEEGGVRVAARDGMEKERAVVFDSGRSAAAEDGLFSDGETEEMGGSSRGLGMAGGSGGAGDCVVKATAAAAVPMSGRANQKQPASGPEIGSTSRKRKQFVAEGDEEEEEEAAPDLQGRMLEALERNDRLLTAQLESQNHNLQLDRDQRKSQTDGLLSVLNRLADALGRIADKL